MWQYRYGQGSGLGGQWGAAADGVNAYIGTGDAFSPNPGGMHAVNLETGKLAWSMPPQPKLCGTGRGCSGSQAGAISAIPGAVFSAGGDGGLRAYASSDGSIIWTFDTNRPFKTVNGVEANGGTMDASGSGGIGRDAVRELGLRRHRRTGRERAAGLPDGVGRPATIRVIFDVATPEPSSLRLASPWMVEVIAFPHRSSTTLAHLGSRFGSLAELSLLIRCNFLERRLGPMYELSTIRSACRAGERAFMQGFRRHCGMSSTARVPLHEFRKRSGHFSAGVGQGLKRRPFPTPPSRSIPRYTLSRMGTDLSRGHRDGKPFGHGPFQAHVELLRLFLTHRENIVESIEAVLNAQRKPTPVPAGPVSFVPSVRGLLLCTHCSHRQPNSSRSPQRPTGRSALGRGIQTSSGSLSA